MTSHAPAIAGSESAERVVKHWMWDYLAEPHQRMPRPGAVCPFVTPALDNDAMTFRTVSALSPHPERVVGEAVRRALLRFPPLEISSLKSTLRAEVLLFPDLVGRGTVIDAVHAEHKDAAVELGLMLGQLHPECDEPSARNAGFAVNVSPLPILAIRHMSVHDILFLSGRASWFAEYDQRFGHLHSGRSGGDPHLRELYENARERFARQDACVAEGPA